jgi:hypothetical protein
LAYQKLHHTRALQFSIVVLLAFVSIQCRSRKNLNKTTTTEAEKIVSEIPTEEKAKPIIDHRFPKVLSRKMLENQFDYKWLNSKFSASTNIDGKTNSFNATVRSRKDSALWISFSLLGIEGARILATKDTVRFIDRVNSKFFVGDYNFLSELLNTDIDFEMLQSILIGNPVSFYDDDEKLRTYIEDGNQVLSTVRKRVIRKTLNNTAEQNKMKELVQRIWLDASSYKVKKNIINDFNTNRTFEGNYDDFQKVDSLLFPFVAEFTITAQRTMKVNINYSKVEINNVQQMPFSIPAKYERMK